jgi:hypothetical protein
MSGLPSLSNRILSSEWRLQTPAPKILQEILAEMIDTTRSGVNLFMNKFKKLPSFTTMAGPHQQQQSES